MDRDYCCLYLRLVFCNNAFDVLSNYSLSTGCKYKDRFWVVPFFNFDYCFTKFVTGTVNYVLFPKICRNPVEIKISRTAKFNRHMPIEFTVAECCRRAAYRCMIYSYSIAYCSNPLKDRSSEHNRLTAENYALFVSGSLNGLLLQDRLLFRTRHLYRLPFVPCWDM